MTEMRKFETGATRNVDSNKYDYEAFLSPLVLESFAAYMHKNRHQADGTLRDGDNWQKGIPKDAYMKSAFRHFMDLWKEHRGIPTEEGLEQALTALMFNVMGYLHETLKARQAEGPGEEDGPWAPGWEERSSSAWRGEGLEAFILDPLLDATAYFHKGEEQAVGHFTHRYGALAHDSEAIEDEASEGETIREVYTNLYKPLQGKEYTTDNDPAFPRLPGMEHG